MSVQKDIERIVDVIACADGGAELVTFRLTMLDIEKREDDASAQIVGMVSQFRKLLDAITNKGAE